MARRRRPFQSFSSRLCVCLASLIFAACSTTSMIKTTEAAKIYRLKADFSDQAELGASPVDMPQDENILRLRLETETSLDQYVMVMFPALASGELKIPIADQSGQKTIADAYKTYFDLLLRAQRKLLTGRFNECKEILTRLDKEYDETYGSTVLRGTLAMFEGNLEEGSSILTYARSMYPEGTELGIVNLIPKQKGAAR